MCLPVCMIQAPCYNPCKPYLAHIQVTSKTHLDYLVIFNKFQFYICYNYIDIILFV